MMLYRWREQLNNKRTNSLLQHLTEFWYLTTEKFHSENDKVHILPQEIFWENYSVYSQVTLAQVLYSSQD